MGNCLHEIMNVVYMSNSNGTVMLEICTNKDCAVIFATCDHDKNTWYNQDGLAVKNIEDGVLLLCNFCGRNGT